MSPRSVPGRAAVPLLALIAAVGAPALAAHPAPHHDAHGKPHGHGAPPPHVVTIRMDDDFAPHRRPEQGKLAGFDPVVANVHVGDRVRFTNVDDQPHSATGYAFGGQQIPENYHFQGDPTKPHGDEINASEWSTGNVRAHSVAAKVFTARTPGTFYYADAYNQKRMRGAIIVTQR